MLAINKIKKEMTDKHFIDLLEHFGAKNIRLEGTDYRCTCPIHQGSNDTSFSYNPINKLWCCFAECGGGDVFTFVAYMCELNLDEEFNTVVMKTAELLNIDITGLEIGNIADSYKADINRWIQYVLKKDFTKNNEYELRRLGARFAISNYRGLSKETIEKNGIVYAKDLNRVLFPIYDEEGVIIGASLRAVDNETKPKWLHRPKSLNIGKTLYNLNNIKDKGYKEVYITEGMMDCLNLIELGIDNVVCTFGAKITREQMFLLMCNFEKLILMFDNDVAGHKATEKVIDKMHKIFEIDVMCLEEYKDPGEIESIDDFNNIKKVKWYEWKIEK